MSFLDILAEKRIIDTGDIPAIEGGAKQTGVSIEEVLRKRGVGDGDILLAKGEYFHMPIHELKGKAVSFEVLRYVPEESVRHYKFAPISVEDNVLHVGVVDPENIEARDALQFISSKINMPFKMFLISETDFEGLLKNYKSLSGEVNKALTELESELANEEAVDDSIDAISRSEPGSDTKIIEDAPVTKMVGTILRHAIEQGASDIHIEPIEKQVRVRYRIDGILQNSIVLPKKVHLAVVARVKILANMRLDEKRKPQDNRFLAHIDNRRVDFRVSTFPTFYGEKVVMRILDPDRSKFTIGQMGLSERNLKLLREGAKKPYGMILISGPTGSGKTTTLYALMNEIDRETKNVLSLEDPVEYNVEGVSQSQVRPEIGYTFASGLRTTLRQDPDVIMVGEIRDKETAALAVQAALTGHLVLSTIHTNSSVGVIPRLVDMGVDPYLIAPTLILAVAQRLVRKMCPDSGKSVPVEGSLKSMIENQFADLPEKYRKELKFGDTLYEVEPTKDCPKGTKGRTAVFEILDVDKDIRHAILTNPTNEEITRVAREKGMLVMKEDAIMKAFNKEIPFEEVTTLGGLEEVEE